MRFPRSPRELRRYIWAQRYGEEEADHLLTLHGKDLAKRLFNLDKFSSEERDRNDLSAAREKYFAWRGYPIQLKVQIMNVETNIAIADEELKSSTISPEYRELLTEHRAKLQASIPGIQKHYEAACRNADSVREEWQAVEKAFAEKYPPGTARQPL